MHQHSPVLPKLRMRFIARQHSVLRHDIPYLYRPYLHPFAGAILEESAAVDILHQVVQIKGFTICNHVFFAKEDVVTTPYAEEPVSTLHCMIKGSIRCELTGVGQLWLRAGQFGFFQLGNEANRAWLKKGEVYESFHIDFTRDQLLMLAPYSDIVRDLLSKGDDNMQAYATPGAGIMSARFYELIGEIRDKHPDHKMKEIAVPANISLLLAIALMDVEVPGGAGDTEEVLFATIRAYILNNLSGELGNREIAREYSMSVSRLKYGYKRIYQEPVQAFVRRARLEKARDLISSTNYPLRQIAEMVGYMDYGSFSRIYRRFYGHPPSDVRGPAGNVQNDK